MKQAIKIAGAILLAGLGILVAIPAARLTLRFDMFRLVVSCPFWSSAILLLLSAGAIHFPVCRRPALFGFLGSLLVGSVAFIAGYIGPIIFMPNANQGPLFGIFFTGPIGSLVGTLIGVFAGIIVNKNRQQPDRTRLR